MGMDRPSLTMISCDPSVNNLSVFSGANKNGLLGLACRSRAHHTNIEQAVKLRKTQVVPQAVALHSREIYNLGIANRSSVHARHSQMVHGVGNIAAAILNETSVDTEQGVLTTETPWVMSESFFDVLFFRIMQSRLDTTDRLRDGSPRRLEAVCEGVKCLGGESGESVPMMIGRADMMPVSIHVTEQ